MTAATIRRAFRRERYLAVGGSITGLSILLALLGQAWTPHDPLQIDLLSRFQAPSADHLFGTDGFGRDVLSRILDGGLKTLALGFGATGLSLALGLPTALAVGYYGGRVDQVVMRLVDALLSIPTLIFALLIVVGIGSSHLNAILALGVAAAPKFTRIVRGAVLDACAEDYVTAARARGETAFYTQYREVLPNIWAPIIVEASIHVGFALMAGAALSYLGLGTQPPDADWGVMVRAGQKAVNQSLWPLLGPAAVISVSIVGFNLFGEGLRDRIDRIRKAGDE